MSQSIITSDLQIQIGEATQAGKRKQGNDDHKAAFDIKLIDRGKRYTGFVAIVADGVGSTVGGGRASFVAIETIKLELTRKPLDRSEMSVLAWLESAIISANQEILFQARENPKWEMMSTTIVIAAFVDKNLYILHLGDSRAYLLRNGNLYQLTTDHSLVNQLVRAGAIESEEERSHISKSQITRFLGISTDNNGRIEIDRTIVDPKTGRLVETLPLRDRDKILLCSDGLYGHVDKNEMISIINLYPENQQQAIEALVQQAIDHGERDDITGILTQIHIHTDDTSTTNTKVVSPEPKVLDTAPDNSLYILENTSRSNRKRRIEWNIAYTLIALIFMFLIVNYFDLFSSIPSISVIATDTPASTNTPVGTSSPTASETPTSMPPATPTPASIAAVLTVTATEPISSVTPIITVITSIPTSIVGISETLDITPTPPPTDAPTDIPTATSTHTPTDTPTKLPTLTPTPTQTMTPTFTPTPSIPIVKLEKPADDPTNKNPLSGAIEFCFSYSIPIKLEENQSLEIVVGSSTADLLKDSKNAQGITGAEVIKNDINNGKNPVCYRRKKENSNEHYEWAEGKYKWGVLLVTLKKENSIYNRKQILGENLFAVKGSSSDHTATNAPTTTTACSSSCPDH